MSQNLWVFDRSRGRVTVTFNGQIVLQSDVLLGADGEVLHGYHVTGEALVALLRKLGHDPSYSRVEKCVSETPEIAGAGVPRED